MLENKGLAIARAMVFLSLFVLVITYTLYNLLSSSFNLTLWVFQTVPLMVMLPGLIRNNLRSYQWLCFLIMLYFIQGVLNIFTPASQLWGAIETLFSVLLFTSAVYFVHFGYKEKKGR